MKLFTVIILMSFSCYGFAQSGKTIYVGAVTDFPISKALYYEHGFGGEASLKFQSKTSVSPVVSFSYLKYQYIDRSFPSGVPAPIYKKNYDPLYRITGGILKKFDKGPLFVNVHAGIGIDPQERLVNKVQPVFLVGPGLILPVNKNYEVKVNASLGYFTNIFFSAGAAFGFKVK